MLLWLVVLVKLMTPPLVSWPWAAHGETWTGLCCSADGRSRPHFGIAPRDRRRHAPGADAVVGASTRRRPVELRVHPPIGAVSGIEVAALPGAAEPHEPDAVAPRLPGPLASA